METTCNQSMLDRFFSYCGLYKVYVRRCCQFCVQNTIVHKFFFSCTLSLCTFVIRCLFPLCLQGPWAGKSPCASGMSYCQTDRTVNTCNVWNLYCVITNHKRDLEDLVCDCNTINIPDILGVYGFVRLTATDQS